MTVDTRRWIVTDQHLHAMNEAAGATITAAQQHQDVVTMTAVQAVMSAYELLLLQWATERGMAVGDISVPRRPKPDPD